MVSLSNHERGLRQAQDERVGEVEQKAQRRKDAEGLVPSRVPGLAWRCTQRNPQFPHVPLMVSLSNHERGLRQAQDERVGEVEQKMQRRTDAEGLVPLRIPGLAWSCTQRNPQFPHVPLMVSLSNHERGLRQAQDEGVGEVEQKTQRRKDAEGLVPSRVPGLAWRCTQRNPMDRRSCESRSPETRSTRGRQRCLAHWVTGFRPRIKYGVTFFRRNDFRHGRYSLQL